MISAGAFRLAARRSSHIFSRNKISLSSYPEFVQIVNLGVKFSCEKKLFGMSKKIICQKFAASQESPYNLNVNGIVRFHSQ